MIEAAVILSAFVQHWPDFAIVLLLLVANAVVGFWEEHQGGNAIAAFKDRLAIKARVKRDGKWSTAEARELVHKRTEATVKAADGKQFQVAKGAPQVILEMSTNASEIKAAVEEADGFAQVFPEHKYHIVDVRQRRGHMVGMTGDGVNDAPP